MSPAIAPAAPHSAMPQVTIYTDGGADPNPGTGGWAAILIDPVSGKTRELSGGEAKTTNNRMELTAAIRGLEALKQPCKVRLITDSQYLRKGVTLWLKGWIANGWKRKDGELQNVDLWRRLAELIKEHHIKWDWVKGHAGDRWNERADELATAAIKAQRKGTVSPGSAGLAAMLGPAEPPPPPPDAEIFLRVSCAGRKAGWAALVRHQGNERALSGHHPGASSNQLDLLAALAALEALPPGIRVAVHTVSDYLRNGASGWLDGWKKRGWKTMEGKPVLHRELWQRLDAALAARRVAWPAVKGRDVPELEALGVTAKAAALGEAS
ncbi:MAG TPA: ribonuclease HI [Thermoanaerobaculia bacterium]|jgi:ribonuclease HI|nr:ribonuclease HI [Thermoanaerobaculia bacterium]